MLKIKKQKITNKLGTVYMTHGKNTLKYLIMNLLLFLLLLTHVSFEPKENMQILEKGVKSLSNVSLLQF